jgi:hypothetical protein
MDIAGIHIKESVIGIEGQAKNAGVPPLESYNQILWMTT